MDSRSPHNTPRRPGYRLRRPSQQARLPSKNRRIGYFVSIGAVLLATVIVVRSLYIIQIRDGEMYSRYASSQQLLDLTIEANRGEIYDATGKTLVSTNVVWNIWCDPSYSTALYTSTQTERLDEAAGEVVTDTVRTLNEAACAEISRELTLRLLSGDGVSLDQVDTSSESYRTQYESIYGMLSKIDSQYQSLAVKVNNAVKDSIVQYAEEYSEKNRRLSISASRTWQRSYPYGAFAASVLGFCNADGEGFYGLEKSYESVLAGVDGRTVTIRNAWGNAIADSGETTFEAKDGDNLVLSLDATVQEVVERYLNEAIAANAVENRGCAIVMDVNTGAILAMASKPDFDPNNPNDYSANLEYWKKLLCAEPELYEKYDIFLQNEDGSWVLDENGDRVLDPEADCSGYFRDIQWKNKNITELYYPGSIFKVITAAMGVDSGSAGYDTVLNCSGSYAVAKETYRCAGKKSHGDQNLAEALRNSCNIYFIQLGQQLGSSLFYDYFKSFGFAERTGVDLPNETAYMQYYTDQNMGEVELASSSFGQAMAITPLQTCTAIAACVNGGYLVTPHVVDRIVDNNGNVVQEIGANVRRQVISASTSAVMRQIMEYEVGGGTSTTGGYRAYVAGYRIGGKSGTSELLNMERRADGDYKKAASFVAVLPADDPEILVYVMLDDPNNAKTDYSSMLAAPVVGNIISEIAPYLGISTDGVDRSQNEIKVPNLVGQEWSNAQVDLNIRGLNHRLMESAADNTGALVTYQYPAAGTVVKSGTTVYLYTEGETGSLTQVPDLTGKSADFARQMLAAADLNCVVTGEGLVQSQSAGPGTSVQRGAIVTLTCGSEAAAQTAAAEQVQAAEPAE